MKSSFYFKHDLDAREDDKMRALIMKHGATGYGIYWMVIEDLYRNKGRLNRDYQALSWSYHQPQLKVKSVVEGCAMFYDCRGKIASRRVDRDLVSRRESSEKASAAGKASAVQRALNKKPTVSQPGEERRGEDRKGEERIPPAGDFEGFWNAYPKRSGREAALEVWAQLAPSVTLYSHIMWAIGQQKVSSAWTAEQGRYIPRADKWLTEKRWEETAFTVKAEKCQNQKCTLLANWAKHISADGKTRLCADCFEHEAVRLEQETAK